MAAVACSSSSWDGTVLVEGTHCMPTVLNGLVNDSRIVTRQDVPHAERATLIISDKVNVIGQHAFVDYAGPIVFKEATDARPERLHLYFQCFYKTRCSSIVLPQRTVGIGANAFQECTIETFVAPPLLFLGQQTFLGAHRLRIVDLRAAQLYHIRAQVFCQCRSLETLHLPQTNLVSIEARAFYGCKSLRDFSMPPSLVRIGNEAFRHCQSLLIVVLPHKIGYIGHGAFSGCRSLRVLDFAAATSERVRVESCIVQDCPNLATCVLPQHYEHVDTAKEKYNEQDGLDFEILESPIKTMRNVASTSHMLTGPRKQTRLEHKDFVRNHGMLALQYWFPRVHNWCPTHVGKMAVIEFYCTMQRLQASATGACLPPELWALVLSFVQRSQLGLNVKTSARNGQIIHGCYDRERFLIAKHWYDARVYGMINDMGYKTRCTSLVHGVLSIDLELWDNEERPSFLREDYLSRDIVARIAFFVPFVARVHINVVPVYAALTIQNAWRAFKQRFLK